MTAYNVAIVEAVAASDRRSFGSYSVLSPQLTYNGSWADDTATPDSRPRAFTNAAGDSVSLSVFNVPSVTFKLQKDYGWGKATIAVDGIPVGEIDCHDEEGGGFLQDVSVFVDASGTSARTISVTSQTADPVVLTNITLDTSHESLGATWVLIPNNMSITESVSAGHSGSFLATALGSVSEAGSASATAWHGSIVSGAQSEASSASNTSTGSIIALSVNAANASETLIGSRATTADAAEVTTADHANNGVRNVFAGTTEVMTADHTDLEHTYHDFFDDMDDPHYLDATDTALVDYKESVVEESLLSEDAFAGVISSRSSTESVTASSSQVGLKSVGVNEAITAGHVDGVIAIQVGVVVEEALMQEANDAIAQMNVAVTEVAQAEDQDIASLATSAGVTEAVAASESTNTKLKGATAILTEANPFLTDIPAVFRVVAVRQVDGVEVESEPTKRLWGRVERSSRSYFTGDIFSPESGRVFPKSDFGRIKPY